MIAPETQLLPEPEEAPPGQPATACATSGRILVAVDRTFDDRDLADWRLGEAIARLSQDGGEVVVAISDRSGGDELIHEIATSHGAVVWRYRTEWDESPMDAAAIRRERMVADGAQHVLAFDCGRDADALELQRLAARAGHRVEQVRQRVIEMPVDCTSTRIAMELGASQPIDAPTARFDLSRTRTISKTFADAYAAAIMFGSYHVIEAVIDARDPRAVRLGESLGAFFAVRSVGAAR